MEVSPAERYDCDIQAMFDLGAYPAQGRRGGKDGACTSIAQDDGTQMYVKGKQFVPHGRKVIMAFPGGAGYGDPSERSKDKVKQDLARGYISAEAAKTDYGLTEQDVASVAARVTIGEDI